MAGSGVEGALSFRAVWRRFRKNRLAVIGLGIVLTVLGMGVFAPLISPYNPSAMDLSQRLTPPSWDHLLGTDELGRDIMSMVIWGARIVLVIGLGTSLISAGIGVTVGLISGFYRGKIDMILGRVAEVFFAIPSFFFYILVLSFLRSNSFLVTTVLMGMTFWPRLYRIVRSDVLSIRERDYVKAAKALGASDGRIITRHVLVNVMSPIIITMTMNMAVAILVEAGLSFLGLGDPNSFSWGVIMAGAHTYLRIAWWQALLPGIFLFLTVLGFNCLGDGLRDSLDPRLRGVF